MRVLNCIELNWTECWQVLALTGISGQPWSDGNGKGLGGGFQCGHLSVTTHELDISVATPSPSFLLHCKLQAEIAIVIIYIYKAPFLTRAPSAVHLLTTSATHMKDTCAITDMVFCEWVFYFIILLTHTQMYTHTHTHKHTYTHTHSHPLHSYTYTTHTHIYTHTYTHICAHTYPHICVHTHTYGQRWSLINTVLFV